MEFWWKKKVPTLGVVLFRGDLPDRLENYQYLNDMGITITPNKVTLIMYGVCC